MVLELASFSAALQLRVSEAVFPVVEGLLNREE
jgi:hypothetical protein